ncbi:MAG TPA: hypothetical protein VFZ61_09360, partial [Polyangiales bacterium]
MAATRHERGAYWLVAGTLLGLASLVKLTAIMIVPAVVALAYTCGSDAPAQRRRFWRGCVAMLGLAAALQAPWEIWQWLVVGSPLPRGAGRPVPELLAKSAYVRYVTVERGPLIYFELLPQVLFTLVPSLLLCGVQWSQRWLRDRSLPLIAWMLLIVLIHTALGLTGYSKVLRYLILVTPATCLLFALQTATLVTRLRSGATPPTAAARALLLLACLGAALELAQ